ASIGALVPPVFDMGGTVTFTDTTNNTVLGTARPITGCSGSVTECSFAVLNANVNQLSMGDNNIVASYGGDSNFEASGPSSAITVTCTAGCSNGTGQTLGLAFYASTPSGPLSAGKSSTTPVAVS